MSNPDCEKRPLQSHHIEMLTEHLPYEINMMNCAFTFIISDGPSRVTNAIIQEAEFTTFLRNLAVESFWIHARSLLEFFWRHSHVEGRTSSANDFTCAELNYDLPFSGLDKTINEQICHLQYARSRNVHDKLGGFEMSRVRESIERAFECFQSNLTTEAAKYWVRRSPTALQYSGEPASATNVIQIISSTATFTSIYNIVGANWQKRPAAD
jgi:hypothetical protein